MTARLGSFDGPAIGVATVSRDLSPGLGVNILFDFGDVRVPAGSRIAFRQRLIAGAMPQFNVGFGGLWRVHDVARLAARGRAVLRAAVSLAGRGRASGPRIFGWPTRSRRR